jgi:hypothetical protein
MRWSITQTMDSELSLGGFTEVDVTVQIQFFYTDHFISCQSYKEPQTLSNIKQSQLSFTLQTKFLHPRPPLLTP